MNAPLVTVVIPSYQQGHFIKDAILSVVQQNIPIELYVMDGGSTDNSIEMIKQHESKLTGWRSRPDNGQSAAINEGIKMGSAPYVCWLNSDDWLLPGALTTLLKTLEANPDAPAVYARAFNVSEKNQWPVWVEPFDEKRLANRCIISQPATLIRRSAWEVVGGLDESLNLALDYDLWWKLYKTFGPLHFHDEFVAVNRVHSGTKTHNNRGKHYQEAITVVRKHYGRVPIKWWLAQPYAVWYKSLINQWVK